jgi:hypothetical protein
MLVALAALLLASCTGTRTHYCYVTTSGHGQVCETRTPLPAVADRHDITIPPEGPCQWDGQNAPCEERGHIVRTAYPTTNPQLSLCPDRQTSFARVNVAMASLGGERLFCVQTGCSADVTVVIACAATRQGHDASGSRQR